MGTLVGIAVLPSAAIRRTLKPVDTKPARTPSPLDDLLQRAEHFAGFAMRQFGRVLPASADGAVPQGHPVLHAGKDGR
jgi:hypothetical protein